MPERRPMRRDDQILARAPEVSRRRHLPTQDRLAQPLRAAADEARVRAADRAGRVRIAAAYLGPAVPRPRQAHRCLRGADAGKAAVEALDAVGMQVWLTQQPVHHRLLYTIPENA